MKSLLLLLVSASSSPWRLLLRSAAAAADVDARRAEVGAPPFPSARTDKPAPLPPLPVVPEAAPVHAFGVLGTAAAVVCCCRCCGATILLAVDVAANGLLAFSFPTTGSSIRLRRSIPALPRGLAQVRSCCACSVGGRRSCGLLYGASKGGFVSIAHGLCVVRFFAVEVFSFEIKGGVCDFSAGGHAESLKHVRCPGLLFHQSCARHEGAQQPVHERRLWCLVRLW